MIKTEMMKKYEAYSGETLEEAEGRGKTLAFLSKYTRWLEAKATAYDRLMSGNPTMKELANITSHPVAIDSDGNLFMYYNTPSIGVDSDGDGGWWDVLRKPVKLPRWFASYDGNWEDSLTLPDGWEEACSKN